MDRTLGEWGRKGIGHWVNGIEEDRRMARKAGEGKKRERGKHCEDRNDRT